MPNFVDLTGQRFGKLTAIRRVEDGSGHNTRWICSCDCGNYIVVYRGHLRDGHTQSCGCLHRELLAKRNYKHGGSEETLYSVWSGMKSRCNNPSDKRYPDYGGRGITVCEEWANDFGAFRSWAIESGYNPDAQYGSCTLDRINVDDNYGPSNCRWATLEQQANNKRNNVWIELNGEIHTQAQWSRITGIPQMTIHNKLKRGMMPCEIFLHREESN